MYQRLNPNQNPIPVDMGGSGGGGAGLFNVVKATANYGASYSDLVDGDPGAGTFAVTLPAAASAGPTGNVVVVKNESQSPNVIVVTPSGGDTIDNNAKVILLSAGQWIYLVSDGVSNFVSVANGTVNSFNVKFFGAVGDATYGAPLWTGTDNTAAFQAAINAQQAAGGGEIVVPDGNYLCTGVLTYNGGGLDDQFASMRGYGTASKIIIDTVGLDWFTMSNIGQFTMSNMAIFGSDQSRGSDCNTAITASFIRRLYLANMLFIGIGADNQIVATDGVGCYFDRTDFLGCSVANVNAINGCVSAVRHVGAYLNGCFFVDFGNLMGINWSRTPNGMPKWLAVMQSAASVGASGGAAFIIESCLFDEGGTYGIFVSCDDGISTVNSVRVVGCTFYIGIFVGVYISNTYYAVVEECSFNCKNLANKTTVQVDNTLGTTFIRNLHVDRGGISGTSQLVFGSDVSLRQTAPIEMQDVEYDSIYPTFASNVPVMNIKNGGVRARLRPAQNTVVANTLGKVGATNENVDQLGAGDNARLATGVILDAGVATTVVRVVEEEGQEVTVLSDGALVIANGDILTSSAASAGRVTSTATPTVHTVGNTVVGGTNVADTPIQMLWARSLY